MATQVYKGVYRVYTGCNMMLCHTSLRRTLHEAVLALFSAVQVDAVLGLDPSLAALLHARVGKPHHPLPVHDRMKAERARMALIACKNKQQQKVHSV